MNENDGRSGGEHGAAEVSMGCGRGGGGAKEVSMGKRWEEMSIGCGRGGGAAEEVSIGRGAKAAVGGG